MMWHVTLDPELSVNGAIDINKKVVNILPFSCISLLVYFKASITFLNPFSEQDGLSRRWFLKRHIKSEQKYTSALYQF